MGVRLRAHEISDILSRYKALAGQGQQQRQACEEIARIYDRPTETILSVIKRFRPSIDAAGAYLQAEALRLAMRVVRKANVSESIDLLSRSNMGVIAPKQESVGGSGGGFFLSVTADTCGAVHMTIGGGREQEQVPSDSLRSSSGKEFEGVIDVEPVQAAPAPAEEPELALPQPLPPSPMTVPGVKHPNQGRFRGKFQKPESEWPKKHQDAARANRQRLKEARSKAAKKGYYDKIDQT